MAAQRMEAAAQVAKDLGNFAEVVDLYKRACSLFVEAGRPGAGAEALFKGARAVEDNLPDEAVAMYNESCCMQEEEGKESNANDCFRAAVSLFIKLQRYSDAAGLLMRWGLAADKTKAVQTQNKAYLSAILCFLYAQEVKQAEQTLNDVAPIDSFYNSEQGQLAEKLISAYSEGDADEVKYIIKNSNTLNHLDHKITRLAKQLPTGDMAKMSAQVGGSNTVGSPSAQVDEDNLL